MVKEKELADNWFNCFYNKEQEYAICTPVDPLLFFGKADEKGAISLLSEQEAEQLQPMLEDMLLDEI